MSVSEHNLVRKGATHKESTDAAQTEYARKPGEAQPSAAPKRGRRRSRKKPAE